jgi:peptide/nickel transport system ATP-binding protein
MSRSLLKVRDLSVEFGPAGKGVRVLDRVGFDMAAGDCIGIVGESGSGKSVMSLSLLRLIPEPPGRIVEGSVEFDGVDLLTLPLSRMPDIRGKEIAMIFQEPMSALNPVMTVGEQISEAIFLHESASAAARRARVLDMLQLVGIPDAESRYASYPHEFSGGMRQRVMIAMALACNPKLLIADEPTTALDVTIQAQILDLLRELVAEENAALILITHDLGVVAGMCERVNVMYAGMFMETGSAVQLFASPRHPYTVGLLQSIPRLDAARREQLQPIEGTPRDMLSPPQACPFQPRCRYEVELSRKEVPPLAEIEPGHKVACFNPVPAEEWKNMRAVVVS